VKFLLNFQGIQAELDTEEDFLSYAQREKETLPNFYRRFLQLKAQALEVSNDQVIAQAIKALHAGPLHSHLLRERPKIVLELDEQFAKFSKSEVQHFCKLEQQRKTSKPHKAPRLPCYNNSQCIASTQTVLGHQRIMRRILGHLRKKEIQGPPIKDSFGTIKEVAHQIMVVVATKVHTHSNLHTACSTIIRLTIAQKIAPYSSSPNEKWTKNPTSLHSK
jgi:hypothetical protein